jgi:hypothetical protein
MSKGPNPTTKNPEKLVNTVDSIDSIVTCFYIHGYQSNGLLDCVRYGILGINVRDYIHLISLLIYSDYHSFLVRIKSIDCPV